MELALEVGELGQDAGPAGQRGPIHWIVAKPVEDGFAAATHVAQRTPGSLVAAELGLDLMLDVPEQSRADTRGHEHDQRDDAGNDRGARYPGMPQPAPARCQERDLERREIGPAAELSSIVEPALVPQKICAVPVVLPLDSVALKPLARDLAVVLRVESLPQAPQALQQGAAVAGAHSGVSCKAVVDEVVELPRQRWAVVVPGALVAARCARGTWHAR